MSDSDTVSFQSKSLPDYYIRHFAFLGVLTQFKSPQNPSVLTIGPLEKLDATFILRPGLSGTPQAVSFESVNYPEHFLRHQEYRIKLHHKDAPDFSPQDATFLWRQRTPLSLESINFPGHFVRHQNHELWLAPPSAGNTATFGDDTTFIPWPGLRPPADTVSFQSVNRPDRYIRHSFYLGELTQVADVLAEADATFIVRRPGLSGGPHSVSFESVNKPGQFLRHQEYRIKLHHKDAPDFSPQDASFLWQEHFDPLKHMSLESVNFPGHFVRHQNHELWLAPPSAGNTATFRDDVTFIPWPGLRPRGVDTASFESVNKPKHYIRHSYLHGELTPLNDMLDKADATFIIRKPGLSETPDSVSWESANYPGHYLRHQDYRLVLQRDDGSNLFRKDATFLVRQPALSAGNPNAVSLESVNPPGHFIRHQENRLWLARPDAGNTATFSDDASFVKSEGFVTEPIPCGDDRLGAAPAIPTGPVMVPTFISTVRMGQLTGSPDPQGLPVLNDPDKGNWENAGVEGVDLGAGVEHNGRLYIYFGDVAGPGAASGDRIGADLVGWTTDRLLRPGGFTLHPVRASRDGWFDPFSLVVDGKVVIPGLARTPSGGFSYKVAGKDKVFVFSLWSDPKNPNPVYPTTVLASKEDPSQPGPYCKEFTFSYLRFWSVVPSVVRNAEHPRLPMQHGDGLVLLAGGFPDAVYLAWMRLDATRGPLLSTVRYYTGNPANPSWSDESGLNEDQARANPEDALQHEHEAAAVVNLPPYFSSVSAAWIPNAKRWVLLNSTAIFEPHIPAQQRPTLPIVARFGTNPWSWSTEVEIFHPCRDLAFGHFIHWTGLDDIHSRVPPLVLPPPVHNDKDAWDIDRGHAYGASVLRRFTQWDAAAQELTLAYLLSTWNPYQVHVMCTKVRLPAA